MELGTYVMPRTPANDADVKGATGLLMTDQKGSVAAAPVLALMNCACAIDADMATRSVAISVRRKMFSIGFSGFQVVGSAALASRPRHLEGQERFHEMLSRSQL